MNSGLTRTAYFQALIDEMRGQHNFTLACRAIEGKNYYLFSSGTTDIKYGAKFTNAGTVWTYLWICFGDYETTKNFFDALKERESEINTRFDMPLYWSRRDDIITSRIYIERDGSIESNASDLEVFRAWHVENLLKFKEVFTPEIQLALQKLESREMELRQGLQGVSKIHEWSNRYNPHEDTKIANLVYGVQERGYLKKQELIELACWKLPDRWKRGKNEGKLGLVKSNSSDDVERFTRDAFLSTGDSDSMHYLCELNGIGSAIASAILHWFHKDRYPIWDIYARWSVQIDKNYFSFTRWKAYVEFCRTIADRYEVDMRTLDRALFKYGENNIS